MPPSPIVVSPAQLGHRSRLPRMRHSPCRSMLMLLASAAPPHPAAASAAKKFVHRRRLRRRSRSRTTCVPMPLDAMLPALAAPPTPPVRAKEGVSAAAPAPPVAVALAVATPRPSAVAIALAVAAPPSPPPIPTLPSPPSPPVALAVADALPEPRGCDASCIGIGPSTARAPSLPSISPPEPPVAEAETVVLPAVETPVALASAAPPAPPVDADVKYGIATRTTDRGSSRHRHLRRRTSGCVSFPRPPRAADANVADKRASTCTASGGGRDGHGARLSYLLQRPQLRLPYYQRQIGHWSHSGPPAPPIAMTELSTGLALPFIAELCPVASPPAPPVPAVPQPPLAPAPPPPPLPP